MGVLRNIFTKLHQKTKRDYFTRMADSKVECMGIAKKYEKDFWDGDRRYGYGGYKYDGRWEAVARDLIEIYQLNNKSKILDVGCGKAFLLYEIKKILPNIQVVGFDISEYAIKNAKEEVAENLFVYDARSPFPFGDEEFDLVISLGTLHNLALFDLKIAFSEIERVGKQKYIMAESYRNNQELFNLQCWALTCESFLNPSEWIWIAREFGYKGDYEFIYFE
ncbi:class I SAM-dependent methyltransferase [Helicobacter canadensis]|uniref:Methyltransferase n=1 Tax=Helicobacter canadensis MIT 98-5491 TaxID=537970 RepID=C5ZZ93_9HELI|nr:class I SAM-dependent methyltransferase [Helicobacter canadensis]EES89351.1 putative methyltransferase [Helicobacter canadensis MIT 98-5491]EFR48138.1 methyltransferase domain protein [Helicobacter canadensis MIT 98-5491]STO99386.1 SAM-dependent methyltransferase [Helicobacter canadensis]